MVEAGYLARVTREPALVRSLAPTFSPIRAVKFGATFIILSLRYMLRFSKSSYCCLTLVAKAIIQFISTSLFGYPTDDLLASRIDQAISELLTRSSKASRCSSESVSLSLIMYRQSMQILLSQTILASSGKCHPYHSLILMVKRFKFFSICAIKAVAYRMCLSCFSTSSEIL